MSVKKKIKNFIGNFLKLTRISKGMTQKKVADELGVSQATISYIENKDDDELLKELFRLYGIKRMPVEVYSAKD